MKTNLTDPYNRTGPPSPEVIVETAPSELTIQIEGYGCTHLDPGFAPIICLQWEDGEFRLTVYSDINDEEPTHTVTLEKARESNREVDDIPQEA
jgi:hypothetical protein